MIFGFNNSFIYLFEIPVTHWTGHMVMSGICQKIEFKKKINHFLHFTIYKQEPRHPKGTLITGRCEIELAGKNQLIYIYIVQQFSTKIVLLH